MKNALTILALLSVISCKVAVENNESQTFGSIDRIDPSLDNLIEPGATIEVLSSGYEWSEGPVWVESENMLLFSDVPTNKVYKWTEADSIELYLEPSGYTGEGASTSNEQGSNELALNSEGKLVLCQHGDRRVAIMDASLASPQPKFIPVADQFEGKKFNSPNDVAIRKNGDYFFTDPPYGMPKDETQQIPFQGVYSVANGTVTLLVDSITRPNGIAFMPDEKTMLVANSDPEKAIWYSFDLTPKGTLTNAKIFHDATEAAKTEDGLPDGLKIDQQGNVFATGPGGIWIFSRDGKLLGKIKIPA
ncbi:MAG TPA: SMP-30/gluconolactonase/LRE family protein, partial [Chryseosolibacter sp.]|nr:SMP-30/gluconolactonase/LRE family protein [Chryseosolibacter sp.]